MRRLLACAALALLYAGCGGGGSGNSGGRATPQMGSATLTLAFPTSSASVASSSRHVLYVDPATQSVGVSVNGSAQQVTNVGASSPNCTSSNSLLSCTVDISAPYGNDTFAISLYSGANATGAVIGTASASGDVSFGSPFVISASVSSNYFAYFGTRTGIDVFNESGALQTSLPIPTTQLALDDSGNIYSLEIPPTPSPSGTPPPGTVSFYKAGTTTSSAAYVPSLSNPVFVQVSGAGELGILSENSTFTMFDLDVWNPGASGAPSYTLPLSLIGFEFFFSIRHDGTIYLADNTGTSLTYDVYPPGSTTPSRTIPETIVPSGQIVNFAPNYMTVGPDGTLYVTEYEFAQPDTLAGLYVYPPTGPERFIATTSDVNGAGPDGVDLDAFGNVYVANNNSGVLLSTCVAGPPVSCSIQNDSLHDIEVFSPGATSVLRHITGNFDPVAIAVAPDGTQFISGFQSEFLSNVTVGPNASYIVAPGASTFTQITTDVNDVIYLYDGYEALTAGYRRHAASYSSAGAAAHGGAAGLFRYAQRLMQFRAAHPNSLMKR